MYSEFSDLTSDKKIKLAIYNQKLQSEKKITRLVR